MMIGGIRVRSGRLSRLVRRGNLSTGQTAPVWSTDWGNWLRSIGNHAVLLEASVSFSYRMLVCGAYFHSVGAGL